MKITPVFPLPLLLGIFLVCCTEAKGQTDPQQRMPFRGQLFTQDGKNEVTEAHIISIQSRKGTISNSNGIFQISVKRGDTLEISSIGFITLKYPIFEDEQAMGTIAKITLMADTHSLKAIPIFGNTKWEQFKEDFTSMEVAPSSTPLLPKLGPAHIAPSGGGAGVVVSGPITALYNHFSKYGTQHRKMRKARAFMAKEVMEVERKEK